MKDKVNTDVRVKLTIIKYPAGTKQEDIDSGKAEPYEAKEVITNAKAKGDE